MCQPSLQTNRALADRAFDATNGNGEVLRAQRIHDLIDAHTRGGQIGGTQLHRQLALGTAHHPHLGDPQ